MSQVNPGMAPTGDPGRHFLCPRCARRLRIGEEQCPACGQAFKSRQRALFWSVIAPGGGYFYTGHPVFGVMDAMTETVLLVALIAGIAGGLNGDAESWTMAGFVGVALALEKLLSIYHANHYVAEFLPAT